MEQQQLRKKLKGQFTSSLWRASLFSAPSWLGMHEREKHKNISTFPSTLLVFPSCPSRSPFLVGFILSRAKSTAMPKNLRGCCGSGEWLGINSKQNT